MSRLIIGLEGHDGTGKSYTAKSIAKLMGIEGNVFFSDDITKQARHEIYQNQAKSHEEKMAAIEEIYRNETKRFEDELGDKDIVIFDRTFISHSVEENVLDRLDRDRKVTYKVGYYPDGVIKPTIIFQVLIPEDERNRRVIKRNEPLTKRDKRLTNDDVYRQSLELERSIHGCIKLNLRLRDPETCALRVVQSLLGNKLVEPFSLNLK